MQEMHKMQVRSLSWEDRLECPMDRGAWRYSPWGQKDLDLIQHTRMPVQQLPRV